MRTPLDKNLAGFAIEMAVTRKLRGSDVVYAAAAFWYGIEPVTLDREQLERLQNTLPVRTP